MSDSVRPHRWQPTRLPRPWDSPGKNTGAGSHFLLQCMKVKSESEVAQLCLILCNPMDCSLPGFSVHEIVQARVLEWVAISFSVLLDYFSFMSFWFVQVIAHVRIFFFMAENYSVICIHHSLFIHSSISGPLSCFHHWAFVSSAARNMGVQISLQDHAFNSSEHVPNVEMVDHTEI